jgi:hypothetical protein
VNRIRLLGEKKAGMTDSQWKEHCDARVKTYEEMFEDKIEKATKKLNSKYEKSSKKVVVKSKTNKNGA